MAEHYMRKMATIPCYMTCVLIVLPLVAEATCCPFNTMELLAAGKAEIFSIYLHEA